MRSKALLIASIGLIAGAALALLVTMTTNGQRLPAATQTGKALIGGPFTLTDQTGKRVSDKDFHGRYPLIFFGFTHCPDICPSALQVVSAALEKLGAKSSSIAPIFITLDPERDTPEKLSEYIASFDKRLIGLTGSKDEVAAVAKAYRIYFQVVPDQNKPDDYSVDHSAIFYLMDKDGGYLTHIPHTTNVDQVVKVLNDTIK